MIVYISPMQDVLLFFILQHWKNIQPMHGLGIYENEKQPIVFQLSYVHIYQ